MTVTQSVVVTLVSNTCDQIVKMMKKDKIRGKSKKKFH